VKMFSRLVVVLSISAVAAKLSNDYTFEQFISEHRLKYQASEMESRRELFRAELTRVLGHNAKGLSWSEGMNKFSAMTANEKKTFHGRSKAVARAAKGGSLKGAKELPSDFILQDLSRLPMSVDWREKGVVSAVKDQGHCGSCWAFASTEVVESHIALSTGLLFDLSPQQIAMCAPNPDSCGGIGGCSGATAEIAFEYLTTSDGHYEEFQYPYLSYDGTNYACQTDKVSGITSPKGMINGYVQLPSNNYTALMNAIATVGPVAISVDASAWHAYAGGVFDGCNQVNPDIDHAVVLVGYGEENGQKYWLVRNSWSPTYGEKGYIKVLRTDTEESRCGQDIYPSDGVACNGDDTPETVCGTCGILFDSAYPLVATTV
jgi:cathepsin L